MPRQIAILASANMMPDSDQPRADAFERDEQMGKLVPAFAAHGLAAELVAWKGSAARSGDYTAMLPLLCWDYWDARGDFLAEMAAARCPVFNSPSLLRWNTDKGYLDELGAKGAPVIRTLVVNRATPKTLAPLFDVLDTDIMVVKPKVGAGAWRQAKVVRGEAWPGADALPPGEALVQAFLPSVASEGEYSLLFFDGAFSHACRKTPKAGDYRIQSLYGGAEERYDPTPGEIAVGETVLGYLPERPVYARVDLLRGPDGELKLIELEMVEPYLYLPHAAGESGENMGARALARAVSEGLGRK